MTNRERLEAVFHGQMIDYVPFALKGWRIPQCTIERELRDGGMAVLDSGSVCRTHTPNVTQTSTTVTVEGIARTTTVIETPKGTVSTVTSRNLSSPKTEGTTWTDEFLFKTEADYDAIEFMIRDTVVEPCYETYLKRLDYVGEDAAFKSSAPAAAIHVIMYKFMGIETFSMEMADNEERLMRLHEALDETHRRSYEIVAKSPAEIIQVGGNYCPEVLGKKRFDKFIVPHWEEVCAIMHEEGKLVGCHLDANNKLWAREVGESGLDWIESFSPDPDTDMTVAEAREAWPGKVLFVNFPSAVHLCNPEVIRKTTVDILWQSAPGDRLIIGIAESVPDDRWPVSFPIILETCKEHGKLPIGG